MRIGFFTKFSEPVIIRLFFYTVIGKSLFDRNTFRSFLTLGDDGQPVCTANVVGCLIHDSSTSSKKLLVFLCSLEYRIKALTIQGVGFDAYSKRYHAPHQKPESPLYMRLPGFLFTIQTQSSQAAYSSDHTPLC